MSNLVITNGYAVSSNSFTWYYDFSSSNDLNDFIIESGGSAAVTVSNGICTINDADDASYLALSNTRNVTDPGTYVIRMRVESSSVLENAKIILGQTLQHMTNYLSPSMMVTPREMPAGDTVTNTLESGYNTLYFSFAGMNANNVKVNGIASAMIDSYASIAYPRIKIGTASSGTMGRSVMHIDYLGIMTGVGTPYPNGDQTITTPVYEIRSGESWHSISFIGASESTNNGVRKILVLDESGALIASNTNFYQLYTPTTASGGFSTPLAHLTQRRLRFQFICIDLASGACAVRMDGYRINYTKSDEAAVVISSVTVVTDRFMRVDFSTVSRVGALSDVRCSINDMRGTKLIDTDAKTFFDGGQGYFLIDTSRLPTGGYLVGLSGNGYASKKRIFVKAR